MERLTIKVDGRNAVRLGKAYGANIDALPDFDNLHLTGDVADRLAAYEDTDLAPEEIIAIINGHRGISGDPSVITLFGKPLSHWLELHKAEEAGMLVHLPCPLGTTIYIITAVVSRGYPDPLIEEVIREETFSYQHIGISPRYLFFTYAEAEAALKKRKEE